MRNALTCGHLSNSTMNVSKHLDLFNHLLVLHRVDDNCGAASTLGEDERSAVCTHLFDQLGSIRLKFGN